jgi:hypothetical protein
LRVDPLRKGKSLTWWVEQADPRCEVQESDQNRARTTGERLPPPTITTEPCPGSPLPHLDGLVAGATVRLRVDGADCSRWRRMPPDMTSTSAA